MRPIPLALALALGFVVPSAAFASGCVGLVASGDEALLAETTRCGYPGAGTAGSPFRVSGQTAQGARFHSLVSLSGTSLHVVVEGNDYTSVDWPTISLTDATHVTLRDNVLRVSTLFPGPTDTDRVVFLTRSVATLEGNTILGPEQGVEPRHSGGTVLIGNSVQVGGAPLWAVDSDGLLVEGNTFAGNEPLTFLGSPGALVVDNDVRIATPEGTLADAGSGVTLADSPDMVFSLPPSPGPNVIGGPLKGGNHWSAYRGADLDGDGLGDVPHAVPGLLDVPTLALDHHPLVSRS